MSAKRGEHDPGSPVSGEENFLRRWSRRKQEAQADDGGNDVAPPVEPEEVPAPAAPEPLLTDADMPPIESLTPDSDFSGFMSPGVSEALRSRALRVLFRSPEFNVHCPLDGEYYDCANTTPLGSIITHDMREEMAREAEKRLAALARERQDEESGAANRAAAARDASSPAAARADDEDGQHDA